MAFRNRYACPKCKRSWEILYPEVQGWSAASMGICPECDCHNVPAVRSVEMAQERIHLMVLTAGPVLRVLPFPSRAAAIDAAAVIVAARCSIGEETVRCRLEAENCFNYGSVIINLYEVELLRKPIVTISESGIELSDSGVIEFPDDEGCIRRRDKDGDCVECRRRGEDGYSQWAVLFRDVDVDSATFCSKAANFRHEPDPATLAVAEGPRWTVDVHCKHCGRSGSAAVDPADISF